MAAEAGPHGDEAGWRGIDALAALVGSHAWLEGALFELTGNWATRTRTAPDASDGSRAEEDELAVWCAAVARRHGELAGRFAERLPLRAGVDAPALVRVPGDGLAEALERIAALDELAVGVGVLVAGVLPWVDRRYRAHLATASAVNEASVAEVLVEARRTVLGEIRGGRSVGQTLRDDRERALRVGSEVTLFDQMTANARVFPAVRPS